MVQPGSGGSAAARVYQHRCSGLIVPAQGTCLINKTGHNFVIGVGRDKTVIPRNVCVMTAGDVPVVADRCLVKDVVTYRLIHAGVPNIQSPAAKQVVAKM